MVYYPIARLLEAGIQDILIISGPSDMGQFAELLGDGDLVGAKLTYKVQTRPGGTAQALGLAREFVGKEPCVMALGDNFFAEPVRDALAPFLSSQRGAHMVLKRVDDARRYGVAEVSNDGRTITSLEEKPANPKSNLAVTGLYAYDATVFDIIDRTKAARSGEIEITSVNAEYMSRGELRFAEYSGEWIDAGTIDSYHKANRMALERPLPAVLEPLFTPPPRK